MERKAQTEGRKIGLCASDILVPSLSLSILFFKLGIIVPVLPGCLEN